MFFVTLWYTYFLKDSAEKVLLMLNSGKFDLTTVQSQQRIGQNNDVNDVILVSLLLTLSIFHTLFCCFHC